MDAVVDYDGNVRYASVIHFDWFDVDGTGWMAERYRGYEVVTDSYLKGLRERIRKQKSRCSTYSPEMLRRLRLAEKLLEDLDCGREAE